MNCTLDQNLPDSGFDSWERPYNAYLTQASILTLCEAPNLLAIDLSSPLNMEKKIQD